MRFLVDECTGPAVARWLREQQHDVFSVFEDARGMDDDEIVQKAFADRGGVAIGHRIGNPQTKKQDTDEHGIHGVMDLISPLELHFTSVLVCVFHVLFQRGFNKIRGAPLPFGVLCSIMESQVGGSDPRRLRPSMRVQAAWAVQQKGLRGMIWGRDYGKRS